MLILLKAMRVHQWVKNLLLFVPLLMAHRVTDGAAILGTTVAFVIFSLCASAAYLFNDVIDLEADRHHRHKRRRPLAAEELSVAAAVRTAIALLAVGIGLSLAAMPPLFSLEMLAYIAATTLYSLHFKKILPLDVLFLAGFYAYRVLVGGTAAGVEISPWMLAFSTFFFFSLAFVKRFADLRNQSAASDPGLDRSGYGVDDLEMFRSLGVASGFVSVLVLALYINSDEVNQLYARPQLLWLICPCLLYWISRVWFIAHRGRMHHDPIVFAIKDKVSYAVGLVILLVGLAASL